MYVVAVITSHPSPSLLLSTSPPSLTSISAVPLLRSHLLAVRRETHTAFLLYLLALLYSCPVPLMCSFFLTSACASPCCCSPGIGHFSDAALLHYYSSATVPLVAFLFLLSFARESPTSLKATIRKEDRKGGEKEKRETRGFIFPTAAFFSLSFSSYDFPHCLKAVQGTTAWKRASRKNIS